MPTYNALGYVRSQIFNKAEVFLLLWLRRLASKPTYTVKFLPAQKSLLMPLTVVFTYCAVRSSQSFSHPRLSFVPGL